SWLLVDEKKYEYKNGYKSTNGKITWRCYNTEFPNCPGSVYTFGYKLPIYHNKDHEHQATIKTDVKAVKAKIKNLASEQPDSTYLPTYNSSRQLCRNSRINPYEKYDSPSDLDFILHEDFKSTYKNENFIFFDSFGLDTDNSNRMMIFTTDKNLQLLNENRRWLCDGTFDAAPSLFKQLFTVHILKNGKNLPLVYGLFVNKQQATYTKFFELLKEKLNNDPLSLSCDYELAIINSIEEIFPECEIHGCFFHLKKSIWRNVQDCGLVTDYTTNEEIRMYCKMLACLAFVPIDDVIIAFESLKKVVTNSSLQKLYTYFEKFYIGPMTRDRYPKRKTPQFQIEQWNCHDRTLQGLPRTNNNLEGWHHALQSNIKSHPHLLCLIDSLKLEQSNTENLYIQLSTGLVNKRKAGYIILEEKLNQAILNYSNSDKMSYLKHLSFMIEFK
ncbi:unnamed protein product, partial [Brachionus calyciflorus]